MKNLIQINRLAINALAFLTSPAGLVLFIVVCATVEGLGISLFYSRLFVDKFSEYAAAIRVDATLFAAGLSLLAGGTLALMMMLGVLVLKMIGKGRYSVGMSFAFALLSVVTYWLVLDAKQGFNFMKLAGVCLMVAVPSVLVAICSSHLADLVSKSHSFKEFQNVIFEKSTAQKSFADFSGGRSTIVQSKPTPNA